MGFRIAPAAVGDLARGPELDRALLAAASAAAERAEGLAEDRNPPIRAVRRGGRVRIENASPRAMVEEFGGASRAPVAPLRRAVRESGLRLDEAR